MENRNRFVRTEKIIGRDNMDVLENSKVLVFGVGGVGGFVCEALARAGIGTIGICDADIVSLSNINRQIIADTTTVGREKTEVMAERIEKINPQCKVIKYSCFYGVDNVEIDFRDYDYVVDAIDTVSAKLLIIEEAKKHNIPVISSMGTGNKVYNNLFQIADIEKTSVCPLAKVMRKELRKRNIKGVKVLFSTEEPIKQVSQDFTLPKENNFVKKKDPPGSISFVPGTCGLLIGGEVIRDLLKI